MDPNARYGNTDVEAAAHSFSELLQVMGRLRAPGGCPWDYEQTHDSLAKHLIEEAYETVDAISSHDVEGLEEELGDVLLQVVFHSEIASGEGTFQVRDVIDTLTHKLIVRHPHVFGDVEVSGPQEVVANWESLKSEHKQRRTIEDDMPAGLPSMLFAHKVYRRLSGVDRAHIPSRSRLDQLIGEDLDASVLGEILFELVGLADMQGIDPDRSLKEAATGHLRGNNQDRPDQGVM